MIASNRSALEPEAGSPAAAPGPRRTASSALMRLTQAVRLLTEHLVPVAPEAVPLAEGLGGTGAVDCHAPRAIPEFATALRDGWAVRGADVVGASPFAPILVVGRPPWVEAGARLSEDVDTILPPEAIEGSSIVADVPVGEGVRTAGAEASPGTLLLATGQRVTALHRLALQAAGFASLALRRPRLTLIVAGAPEADTLSPLLAHWITAAGALVANIVAAKSPDAIADVLRTQDGDAVLTIGGTGFGHNDHASAGLALAGTVRAHGIALQPGDTAGFGEVGGRPVILLPGRPDAALGAFVALARPLIASLSGARAPAGIGAPLLGKIASTIGMSEIVFARRMPDGLLPLGGSDLALASLIHADAAILVGPESEGYPAGRVVPGLAL
ncbi:molybdopterin-binding protein [Methylobacterium sp. Leaf88]|uniref:molybdopterin-binding protein n=1 Tax=Methylobacterium sp. Leaf88 TaxID=1736244 RepID=UPI0012E882F6|nr:molybdopterin-binding protein [Methylobacterium sp. Leaf88]